jgi:hypothetical protein
MYNQKLRNRLKNKKLIEEDEEIEEEDVVEYINDNPYDDGEVYIAPYKQDDPIDENKKLPGKYKLKKHLNKLKSNNGNSKNRQNKSDKNKNENILDDDYEYNDEIYKQEADYYDDIILGNEYDPEFEDLHDDHIDNYPDQDAEFVDDNLYLDNSIEDYDRDRVGSNINPIENAYLRNNLI